MENKAPTLFIYTLLVTSTALVSSVVNPTGANPLSLTHYLRYWHQQQTSTLSISLITRDRVKPMTNRFGQLKLTKNLA